MRLGQLIADYRFANRIGVRELANEIGMSHASLCRIENGRACGSDQIAKLMLWLFTASAEKQRRVKPTGAALTAAKE